MVLPLKLGTTPAFACVLECGATKEWPMRIQCGARVSAAFRLQGGVSMRPWGGSVGPLVHCKAALTSAAHRLRTCHALAAPHSKTQAGCYVEPRFTSDTIFEDEEEHELALGA